MMEAAQTGVGNHDRILRRLEAMLVIVDARHTLLLTGNGDVVQPTDGILGVGSGGNFAVAARRCHGRDVHDCWRHLVDCRAVAFIWHWRLRHRPLAHEMGECPYA